MKKANPVKKLDLILALVVILVLIDTSTLYAQYTLTDDDVVVVGGVITSCSYNFEQKDIVIPGTLDGQTVISVEDKSYSSDGVFYNKGITSVTLPSTLENIGAYAFYNNDLVSVSFPASITSIGSSAFYSNSLIALDLSGCVALEVINDDAFHYNKIASVAFPESLVTIGSDAFYSNSITALDLSGCVALEVIDDDAFRSNKIASVAFPESLVTIGSNAFYSNSLTALDLSGCNSLLEIGSGAFNSNYSLTSFALPEVTYNSTLYNQWIDGKGNSYTAGVDDATDFSTFYTAFIPYTLTDDDVVAEGGVITSCSYDFELKNIVIPGTLDGQTIISIADKSYSSVGVFYYKGITSVTLPSTLENIGAYAFYNNDLVSVSFPASITSIGSGAFDLNSLTALDLSGCVALKVIDNDAFRSNKIASVAFPESLVTIGSDAFYSNSLTALDFSACTSLVEIGSYAFRSNSITSFTLPDPIFDKKILNYWEDNDGETYSAGESVTDLTNSYTANMMQFCQSNFYAMSMAVPQPVNINLQFNCPDRGMNITSLNLSNNEYNINQVFPLFVIAGDTSFTIALNIPSPETYLYMAGYEITYSSDGHTKTYSDSLYVAIIINDNSELSYIGNQAIDAYNASLDSNELALQNNKAVIFRLFGEYDKAETNLNSALSIALDKFYGFTGIKMNIGVVKSDKKSVTEAMEKYNDVLTDLSGETETSAIAPRIYYNIAWEYYNLKDYNNSRTKALATINHQKSNDYLIAKAYVLLGVIDAATGDTMSAIVNFRDAINTNPGSCIADIASENIVLLGTDSFEFVSICGGDNYHGWEESGQYTRILESADGGDSIVTTFLTVNPAYHINQDISICQGENYNGLTTSGVYSENLVSVSGCDSIVTVNLTVNPVYNINLDTTICQGENYGSWTTSGIYVQNLITQSGCDSIITINLTVENCQTGLGHEKGRMFNLYPNPSSGTITLVFRDDTKGKTGIKIVNSLGKAVYEEEINGDIPEHILHLGTVSSGIYIISVRTGHQIYYEQIVVQ